MSKNHIPRSVHAISIITSNNQDKNEISSSIDTFFKRFNLATIAQKSKGVSFLVLFSYLVTTIFSNRSAFHDFQLHQNELGFSEAILQLLELFKEVFTNEMVLSEEILTNIMNQFIQKLPQSTQNQLKMIA